MEWNGISEYEQKLPSGTARRRPLIAVHGEISFDGGHVMIQARDKVFIVDPQGKIGRYNSRDHKYTVRSRKNGEQDIYGMGFCALTKK